MKFSIFAIILLFSVAAMCQEEEQTLRLPSGLGVSNQLKYSNDIDTKREIFENWLNLDYTYGIFTTGIRFDIFQPVNYSTAWKGGMSRYSDIGFKYVKGEIGDGAQNLEITVGNYYCLFGRGMIVKSYEDRNLREDNNLLGVKARAKYASLTLTAITGMPLNKDGSRSDVLHAADLEYAAMKELKAGFTIATNQKPGANASATTLTSFRIQPSMSFLDAYLEYGIKQDNDINRDFFNSNENVIGKAFYGNLNLYTEGLSYSGEYKYYDNFGFMTSNGSVYYNTPPATRKDYTYTLLSRHTVSLDADNEQGFLNEITYQITEGTSILGAYGLTQTLPNTSWYKKMMKDNSDARISMKEVFGQIIHHWNDNLTTILAFGYNEESKDSTKNFTPIVDVKYNLTGTSTVHCIFEHQQTKNRVDDEQYYSDALTLEYLKASSFSVGVLTEMLTKEPVAGNKLRKVWCMAQFGYQFGEQVNMQLSVGSRQAGTICIGGICRTEPEFSGVELKLFTRF